MHALQPSEEPLFCSGGRQWGGLAQGHMARSCWSQSPKVLLAHSPYHMPSPGLSIRWTPPTPQQGFNSQDQPGLATQTPGVPANSPISRGCSTDTQRGRKLGQVQAPARVLLALSFLAALTPPCPHPAVVSASPASGRRAHCDRAHREGAASAGSWARQPLARSPRPPGSPPWWPSRLRSPRPTDRHIACLGPDDQVVCRGRSGGWSSTRPGALEGGGR